MFAHILKTDNSFSAELFESADAAANAAAAASGKSIIVLASALPYTGAYIAATRQALDAVTSVLKATKGAPALVEHYASAINAPSDERFLLMALAADGVVPVVALKAISIEPVVEPVVAPAVVSENLLAYLRAHLAGAKFLPYLSCVLNNRDNEEYDNEEYDDSDEEEEEEEYDDSDDGYDEEYGVIDIENAKVWEINTDAATATFHIGPVDIGEQDDARLGLVTIPLGGLGGLDEFYLALCTAVARELVATKQLDHPAGEINVKLV